MKLSSLGIDCKFADVIKLLLASSLHAAGYVE